MPKKKNIKKENVLKVLWNECITFKVLIFIIAYVVLAFINMPFEKWLSLYFEWEKLKDYQEVFMEEITLLVILPLMEIAAVALICFIIYEFFCSVSKMIECWKNSCDEKIKRNYVESLAKVAVSVAIIIISVLLYLHI